MKTLAGYFDFIKELNAHNEADSFDEKDMYGDGRILSLKKDGRDLAQEAEEWRQALGGDYETVYDRERDLFCHKAEYDNQDEMDEMADTTW